MLLNQLVEINEKGSIASSVNFGMLDDLEKNLLLCESFIFNYDLTKPELSTVGILDAVRRSYHSPNQPNIHLMIQQYGKGKSHFAIAVANFFKKTFHSQEVQGVLSQVEKATSGKSQAVSGNLKLFKEKQRHQHLVICLSGDQGGDIRKQFLQQLVKNLEEAGIQDSLAQHICSEPLRYLESLNPENRVKAEKYLQSIGNPDGDLNSLIRLLRENNSGVISIVKKVAFEITGFTPDFAADINIQAILEDLIKNRCTGENAHYQGILILFDELNQYLKAWAADDLGAGGTALQNITNICENYKGKIALLSFTQIHPAQGVGISANVIPEYQKIATRLAPKDGTTYNPSSSLELVIENLLLVKNASTWQTFRSQWHNTLRREAETAYEQRIKIYKKKGWSFEEFYTHLSERCFPLHPLTAYLLCNLDFTQDRTAIQFIKGYVKNFIATQPVENAGKLNYIYPIALVDTFIENFSNSSVYNHYKKAVDLVAGSDNDDELMVIKALFLYEASGEKLTKADQEEHQEILVVLTGLTKLRLQTALDKLEKERDLIYHRPEIKLYRFWEGINPKVIQEEIEEKIRFQTTSINDVVAYCDRINILKQDKKDKSNIISATKFVEDNKLWHEDWRFERKIYSIDKFIKALENNRILRDTKEKGILAYVLTETQEELQEFRNTVANYLSKSPIQNYIAVAIPREETGNLDRVILQIKTLEETDAADKILSGKAYQEQLQRWQEEANTRLTRLFNNCTYYCVEIEKIPSAEQHKAQRVISVLLQELYPFVPPVDKIEKMRSDHPTGKKIVRWTATQIFIENSFSQNLPDGSFVGVIDQIFVKLWGLFKKTSDKYIVQEPTNEKIRAAWDKISEITDLEGLPQKIFSLETIWQVLSAPPFGYSEYNFTMLLAGWLAIHRKEISLKGRIKLTTKKFESVSIEAKSVQNWGSTDILQNPTAFVEEWIVKQKSKLIRRQQAEMPISASLINYYDQAKEYLEAVTAFLESNESDGLEKEELTKNRKQMSAAVAEIDKWLQPVQAVENLPHDAQLAALLPLYPQLLKRSPNNSILPTQQQRDRFSQAFQTVSNKIDQLVAAENKRAESLSTEEACNTYKIEIQGIIDQITQIADLPPHLIESLQNGLRTSNIRLTDIRQQAEAGQKQAEDTEIMQNIRNSATKIKTIHLSQAALQEIENLQSRFNYPDKFQDELAEIVQSIQNKITSDRSSLANLLTQLWSVRNLRELDIINTEYVKLDVVFQDSADYGNYQELQPQIQSLKHDLEQIQSLEIRYQQSDSIPSCNDALAIITSGELNIYNADRFQGRISQLEANFRNKIQEYEQKQLQILQQKQAAAQQWVKDLENSFTQINQSVDNAEKLEIANNLLEQIQAEKSDYISLISVTEIQLLENIERQCVEERNKDITNQIFVLLRQLSRLEQQNVYERLGQILSEKTDEQ